MARQKFGTTWVIAAALGLASCTVNKTETPALSGPSELGTSVTVQVSPDVLTQDGASQSLVTITVRDASGQPVRNVSLRANITVGGVITDFGTLSARNVVTDANGRATVVYTAPAAPAINVDNGTIVAIEVIPAGTNFGNAAALHTATIRLVPPGVVGAPPSSLRPDFVLPTPVVGDTAIFSATVADAAGTDATAQVARYEWNFGDGGTASGRTVSHTYSRSGSFSVSLRITDSLGRVAQTAKTITVSPGVNPTADFVVSPGDPLVNQPVNFNATTSKAAPGRRIVSYSWDFGDGTFGTGEIVSHSYSLARTYNVLLTVTDDVGNKGTAPKPVSPK